MQSITKFLPAMLIVLISVILAFFILKKKFPEKSHDEHDHHGEEHGNQNQEKAAEALADHAGHNHNAEEDHSAHNHATEEHSEHEHDSQKHDEHEESHGQISLSNQAIEFAEIAFDTLKAGEIRNTLSLNGIVQLNQDKVGKIMARFPGLVKEIQVNLGQSVKAEQALALIESNESLTPYSIKSPIQGTVIEKNITPGQVVSEQDILFTVANMNTVWIDFNVHRGDVNKLSLHQTVVVNTGSDKKGVTGKINYLSPIGSEITQGIVARIILPNSNGLWKPGLFVDAEVTLSVQQAPKAASIHALQSWKGKDVLFIYKNGRFEMREVVVGQRDKHRMEIVSGAEAGEVYCSDNCFILKAELGKAEAKHEH